MLQQLKLYIDKKSGVVNKHIRDCNTCEYNDGNKCNLEVPEFDTEEATNCTYYAIKNGEHPLGNEVHRLQHSSTAGCYLLVHLLHH